MSFKNTLLYHLVLSLLVLEEQALSAVWPCEVHLVILFYSKLSVVLFPCCFDNSSMQFAFILNACKNDIFQMKKCDICLTFAQNIDCGYTQRRF